MTAHPNRSTGGGRRDPLATLAALRPQDASEHAWSDQGQAVLRQRILASTTSVPTAPREQPRPAPAGRRHAAVIALSGLVLVGGAGAAAAAGLVPQAFVDAFAGWRTWHDDDGDHTIDPGAAQRVATAPGPAGTVFTVMAARSADDPDYRCLVSIYETADSAQRPGPAAYQDASGSGCASRPTDAPFGMLGADMDYAVDSTLHVTEDTAVWTASAGDAVRAELRTADGRTYPALTYDGLIFGWFPLAPDGQAGPYLTGYDPNGAVVGRIDVSTNTPVP